MGQIVSQLKELAQSNDPVVLKELAQYVQNPQIASLIQVAAQSNSLQINNQQQSNPAGQQYGQQYHHPQYHKPLYAQQQAQQGIQVLQGVNPNVLLSLVKLAGAFKSSNDYFQIPKNATCTVYVEGLPEDTTDREVSHIFRPFPGFKSLRLVPRDTKDGQKVHFAFADFETVQQTTMVINTLQGYRFHRDDLIGLQFSYAVANNNLRRHRNNNGGGNNYGGGNRTEE